MFAWFRKDAQRFFRCYRARWLHKSLPIHSPIATRARKGGARDENVAHFSHTRELSPIIRKSFFPSSSFSPVTHTKAHRETDMASASPTQLNSLARRKVFFWCLARSMWLAQATMIRWRQGCYTTEHGGSRRASLAALSRTLAALFELEKATLGVGVIRRHQHTQAAQWCAIRNGIMNYSCYTLTNYKHMKHFFS